MSIIPNIRNILETLYDDNAEVWSMRETKTDYGATKQTYTKVYSGIPCRLSRMSKGKNTDQTISKNDINYELMLILDPMYKIETGDKVEVVKNGRDYKNMVAGDPLYYNNSIQVPLTRETEA